jgi:hypothetical protein
MLVGYADRDARAPELVAAFDAATGLDDGSRVVHFKGQETL